MKKSLIVKTKKESNMGILAFLCWALFMVITGIKARDYNRSVVLWVLVGLVLSPLVSVIAVLVLGKKEK